MLRWIASFFTTFTMKNHVVTRVCLIILIFIVVNSYCLDYFADNNDFFRNKIILAPMIHVNTLSFRILALEQGADIVYSEEIPDHKLVKCTRKIRDDHVTKVVEYVNKNDDDDTVVFQTSFHERGKVIVQIGMSNPKTAVQAASMIQRDVAGIDINLEYSDFDILKNIESLKGTLQKIRKAVCIPVTCKIRVLSTIEETKSLCKHLEMAGVSAIAIHGRTIREKPWKPNRNQFIVNVSREISIPIIACGGSNHIESYDDILKFKNETNCSSVMIGRAAQSNCLIFSKTNSSSTDALIQRYVKLAIMFDDPFHKVQYCLTNMMKKSTNETLIEQISEAQGMREISKIFDLDGYYSEIARLIRLEKTRKPPVHNKFRAKSIVNKLIAGAAPILLQIFLTKLTV